MKVFITGGTGTVGSHVIPALVSAGHTVTALARSDESAQKLQNLGAQTTVLGDLGNLAVLGDESSKADAVIHLAFDHNLAFTGKALEVLESDRNAIAAIANALVASSHGASSGEEAGRREKEKVFINTAGMFDQAGPDEKSGKIKEEGIPRYLSEELTLSYSSRGIRAIVIRLPAVVHGSTSQQHPFIAAQIAGAKKAGNVIYVNGGENVWATCHVEDVADLYVRALESAPSGEALHAIGEEGIPTKEIAEFIAKKMNLPTKSVNPETAMQQLGFIGWTIQAGQRRTATFTKEWTGWNPTHPGLFTTMDKYEY